MKLVPAPEVPAAGGAEVELEGGGGRTGLKNKLHLALAFHLILAF
jgi:hypothetical protein